MPKIFTSETQRTGEIGEHLAVRYLENHGYKIIERNYTRKWGEIDIIATKGDLLLFVEVKSKTVSGFDDYIDSYRPEDNMHPWKLQRLSRTIQTYLAEHTETGDWQFDLIVVKINQNSNEAKISLLENIIL
jgi:putative endonuclease